MYDWTAYGPLVTGSLPKVAAGALPDGTGAIEVVETTHGQSPYGLLRWKTIVVGFGVTIELSCWPLNGPV